MWGSVLFSKQATFRFPKDENVRYSCNVNALFSKKKGVLAISVPMSVLPQISGLFPLGQCLYSPFIFIGIFLL
jgi:hypothetical protein